ncbi:MAG: TonB-dependent receptor [Arenicella sp.]
MRYNPIVLFSIGFSLCFSHSHYAQTKEDTFTLDTLTVVGKRPQRLDEVDAAITTITAEQLSNSGITKVDELEKVFSGLVIKSRGNRAYSNFSIRGVTSPDFYNPSVQIYIDGVPQDAANFTQDLVNVQRIELLRGPQGTLYGRNAHAGVINIVTNNLAEDSKNSAQLALANNEQRARLKLKTALIEDVVLAELNVGKNEYKGDIDDIGSGEKNINTSDSEYVNLALRYTPSSIPLDLQFVVQHAGFESMEELYLRDSLVEDRVIDSSITGTDNQPFLNRETNSYSLNVNYDFDSYMLTSVTGYQDRTLDRTIFRSNFPETQQTFSQELRLAFEGVNSNGTIGGFFQDSSFTRRDPGFTDFFGASLNAVDTKSYALFGELTYALSKSIDITGGGRWSRDEASIDYSRSTPNALSFVSEESFSDFSPKLALGWQLNEKQRTYMSVTRGFKPGGFNHAVTNNQDGVAFDSETSTNIELGWRGSMLNELLVLKSAFYFIDSKRKQIYIGPLGAQVLRNIGDAKSRGVELDVTLLPAKNFSINAGVTYGNSEFVNATDPITGENYDGNSLPYAPDSTAQVSASYIIDQNILSGQLTLNGSARYVSDSFFNESNSLKQESYSLFDASFDLNYASGVKLSIYGKNLTDEVVRTSSFTFQDGARSTINEARLVGIQASVDF